MTSGPFLLVVFEAIYLLAMSIWIGMLVFQIWGLPTLARFLEEQQPVTVPPKPSPSDNATEIVRRMRLWCARIGIGCGVIALPSLVGRSLAFEELRGAGVGVQALCLIAGIFVGFTQVASPFPAPAPNNPRNESGATRRKPSAMLDILVLTGIVTLLFAFSIRPAPDSSGIRELTPEERAHYDAIFLKEFLQKSKTPAKDSEKTSALPVPDSAS